MNKRELFEARVHSMARALATGATYSPEEVSGAAARYVRAVDAALAEIPHAEELTPAPLAWRPMSEIWQATGSIAVAHTWVGSTEMQLGEAPWAPRANDLAWLQLPPLPTGKL